MSQQGGRPTGSGDDWWEELYDGSAGDTGATAAPDSLDDRFASAAHTLHDADDAREADDARDAEGAHDADGARGAGDAPGTSDALDPRDDRGGAAAPGGGAVGEAGLAPSASAPLSRPSPPSRPPAPSGGPGGRAPWEPPTGAPRGPVTFPYGVAPTPPADGPEPPPAPDPEPAPPDGTPALLADRPAGPGHLGSGPPTYDAEPAALPPADPDGLDELVPDTVLEGARYGTCTLRAVSVRGDSARFRGDPRRDALLVARFGAGEDALVLVAMATGARAASGAHRAAGELCRWIGGAVGRSHARLAEDLRAGRREDLKSGLHRLTDRGLGRLRARAAEQGLAPEEYAATLRCLLLPADPGCRTRVFFGVGGGGLLRLRDGVWQDVEPSPAEATGAPVLGYGSPPHPGADPYPYPDRDPDPREAPDPHPHPAAATPPHDTPPPPRDTPPPARPAEAPDGDPLTLDLGRAATPRDPRDPRAPAPAAPPHEPFRFRASLARPGDVLLLCTAGLADPLRGEPALGALLARRWSDPAPPGLTEFLADTRIRVKGYADDRTAAAVWEA